MTQPIVAAVEITNTIEQTMYYCTSHRPCLLPAGLIEGLS